MKFNVIESIHAARDLDLIVTYLVDTLKSPQAANHALDDYETLLEALEETPSAYPLVRDELLAFAGYHWAPVSSYMVFFTIDEPNKEVHIHRIAHSSQEWASLLYST